MDINVGVPHVSRRINEVRNSSYDITIALLDLMDNVEKGFETYIDWQELNYKIKFTYNPQIIDRKIIKYVDNYNYVIMKPLPSLSESRLYEERKMITTIYFDDKGIECYADVNGQCFKWNEDTKRINAYNKEIPKGLNTITIESSSIYGTCFDTTDRTMIANSESPNSEMSELFKDELPKAKVRVYRDNRCLGTVPFKLTKENDGYQNYTTHAMNYKDKKLNKFFGVGSTKGNLVRRDYIY